MSLSEAMSHKTIKSLYTQKNSELHFQKTFNNDSSSMESGLFEKKNEKKNYERTNTSHKSSYGAGDYKTPRKTVGHDCSYRTHRNVNESSDCSDEIYIHPIGTYMRRYSSKGHRREYKAAINQDNETSHNIIVSPVNKILVENHFCMGCKKKYFSKRKAKYSESSYFNENPVPSCESFGTTGNSFGREKTPDSQVRLVETRDSVLMIANSVSPSTKTSGNANVKRMCQCGNIAIKIQSEIKPKHKPLFRFFNRSIRRNYNKKNTKSNHLEVDCSSNINDCDKDKLEKSDINNKCPQKDVTEKDLLEPTVSTSYNKFTSSAISRRLPISARSDLCTASTVYTTSTSSVFNKSYSSSTQSELSRNTTISKSSNLTTRSTLSNSTALFFKRPRKIMKSYSATTNTETNATYTVCNASDILGRDNRVVRSSKKTYRKDTCDEFDDKSDALLMCSACCAKPKTKNEATQVWRRDLDKRSQDSSVKGNPSEKKFRRIKDAKTVPSDETMFKMEQSNFSVNSCSGGFSNTDSLNSEMAHGYSNFQLAMISDLPLKFTEEHLNKQERRMLDALLAEDFELEISSIKDLEIHDGMQAGKTNYDERRERFLPTILRPKIKADSMTLEHRNTNGHFRSNVKCYSSLKGKQPIQQSLLSCVLNLFYRRQTPQEKEKAGSHQTQ